VKRGKPPPAEWEKLASVTDLEIDRNGFVMTIDQLTVCFNTDMWAFIDAMWTRIKAGETIVMGPQKITAIQALLRLESWGFIYRDKFKTPDGKLDAYYITTEGRTLADLQDETIWTEPCPQCQPFVSGDPLPGRVSCKICHGRGVVDLDEDEIP